MNLKESVQSGFENYWNFQGRASRSEYWYWTLFSFIVSLIMNILDAALGLGFLALIAALAFLLPGLAVSVRRFHDIDKSGWWLLLGIIPIIGWIICIYWSIKKGTIGTNRFGDDPLAAQHRP